MKTLVLSVILLYGLVSVRAEDGVEYVHPSMRVGLWNKIVPTLEDIPEINTSFQYELLSFEGCEYYPGLWGSGRNSDRVTLYWSQWGIRQSNWKLCVGLRFTNPSGNNNVPIATGGGFMLFFRRSF